MTDEELIKQGWRKCAEGQRTAQHCAEAEQWRKVAEQLRDALLMPAKWSAEGRECWCLFSPRLGDEHQWECKRATRALGAYRAALEGKP